ncbi:MAG TPA: SgcJ/EcaC family oxidoreductase [Acidisarcina sp.]
MKRAIQCCLILLTLNIGAMAQMTHGDDEASIKKMLADQAAAWDRGDGPGFAAPFSEDADFVNIFGSVFEGKPAIAKQHSMIFAGPYKGTHLTVTLRKITFPSADVALVEADPVVSGVHAMPPGMTPPADGVLKTRMKFVAHKTDGTWQFIAAQNTVLLPMPPPR